MEFKLNDNNIIPYNLNEEEEKKLILKQYKKLIRKIEPKIKSIEDKKNIKKAFQLAAEAHKTMRRKTGEPYILHPIEVALICIQEIGLGVSSTICALLHDTVEDTDITIYQIEKNFNKKIANIVYGLTKISNISSVTQSKQAENIKKILMSLVDDPRVILIKLADRLHNMRTLDSMVQEKRIKISSETMEVYVPIAHRLGLFNIKTELEDLCTKYTDSSLYNSISNKLIESKEERDAYIKKFIAPINNELKKRFNFNFTIEGRTKSISSIGKKMKIQNVEFNEIYDIFAIRIILNSELQSEITNCWQTYAVVSSMFKTFPNRLRDWLNNPKSNGYEALHTTVLGHDARWVEIQIRSKRMNDIAERGIAAHYLYKEKTNNISVYDQWYLQIREMISSDNLDSIDFVTNFQNQVYKESIHVFTPKGEIKTLPSNSTILDFAYYIHSNIGNKCLGAKVNNKLESLSYQLKTGDKVEILTSDKQIPQEKWLEFVQTTKAVNQIKTYFKSIKKEHQQIGYNNLKNHLENLSYSIDNQIVIYLQNYFNCKNVIDLYIKIGTKEINLNEITAKLISQLESIGIKETTNDFIEYKYNISPCCSPIQGDNVIGINIPKLNNNIVNIHLLECKQSKQLLSKYDCKIIQIKWHEQEKIKFLAKIKLIGLDDVGIIFTLTDLISKQLKVNISSFHIDADNGKFEGYIKVFIESKDELQNLILKIKTIKGMVEVNRVI